MPTAPGGVIQSVAPASLAAALGLRPGDVVLAVNGQPVEDAIDVQYYAAADEVEIAFLRGGQRRTAQGRRRPRQALGLEFVHPTFDVDVRCCNNLCPFCFVLQMAPRLRRSLYVKDDDFRYSFLYGQYVTLTNLSAHDWERIEHQHLSPLYISVHATAPAARRACLGNANIPDILEQLRWLKKRGIEMHTQLVITPGLNDGAVLAQSVRDLARLYPAVRSVSVVPVGLTKYHRHSRRLNTLAEAERVLAAVEKWQARYLARFGVRFVYPTDEWFLLTGQPLPSKKYYDGLSLQENGLGLVRSFLDNWRRVKSKIQNPKSKIQNPKLTLVTGKLFETTLRKTAQEFNRLTGAELEVVGVVNERFGPSVTVAGLLMGADVIAQLKERDLGACVILPQVMFDHPTGVSLDDVSPQDVARALGRPVFLAETMEQVTKEALCAA